MIEKKIILLFSSFFYKEKKEILQDILGELREEFKRKKINFLLESKLLEKEARGHLLLITEKELSNLPNKDTFEKVIISYDRETKSDRLEDVEKKFGKKNLGFIDFKHFDMMGRNMIKAFCRGRVEEHLIVLGKDLDESLRQGLLEFQKVKELHEKVVPLRFEKIKGISIYSKFAAGFNRGGEFFDIKRGDRNLIILTSSTKSYVTSSVILSHFEAFKKSGDCTREKIEGFLEDLIDECRQFDLIDRDDFSLLQMDLITIDLRTYKYSGFHFGKGSYYLDGHLGIRSNTLDLNENSFKGSYFEGTLKRGQRIIYLSPGTLENFKFEGEKDKIDKMILNHFDRGAREFLNEVFFQLKKDIEDDFLKYDASVIYLEVDPNAFIQV